MADTDNTPSTAGSGVNFTNQQGQNLGPLVGAARYPAELGQAGAFEKWMLFEVKQTRHVGRSGMAAGKLGGESPEKDAPIAAVALYLPESALKSTTEVGYDTHDLGPFAGVLSEHFAQTGGQQLYQIQKGVGDAATAVAELFQGAGVLDTARKEWEAGKTALGAVRDMIWSGQNSVKNVVTDPKNAGAALRAGVLYAAENTGFGDNATQLFGQRVNPRTDVLFNHVQYRSHDLDFMLIPRSIEEARSIDTIIHFFQYYMLPSYSPNLNNNLTGMLMGFPYEFEITFWTQTQSSGNMHHINKIGRSVLTSVSLNHAAAGKTAFFAKNGEVYPAATSLSLRFQEIRLLARDSEEIDRAGGNTAKAFKDTGKDPNAVEAPPSPEQPQTVSAPARQSTQSNSSNKTPAVEIGRAHV